MKRMIATLTGLLLATAVNAAELTLISGGAVEPGVHAAVHAFEKATGHKVKVTFNTTPQMQKRISAGDTFDVVIAPPATTAGFAKDGKVDAAFADGLQLSFWVSSPAAERCCALFDGPYLSQQFLGEGMTIMLRQQDADLTAAINHALATLSRDGRLQEIYLRYFPYGLY